VTDAEEIERMVPQVRRNLVSAGMIDNRIEEQPLAALSQFIYQSHLAMNPFTMAIAYQAIAWTLKQRKVDP
jgi:hypothetical protein